MDFGFSVKVQQITKYTDMANVACKTLFIQLSTIQCLKTREQSFCLNFSCTFYMFINTKFTYYAYLRINIT